MNEAKASFATAQAKKGNKKILITFYIRQSG